MFNDNDNCVERELLIAASTGLLTVSSSRAYEAETAGARVA